MPSALQGHVITLHSFSPLSLSGSDLSVVDSAKILGLTMSSDLSWNKYFLILLCKAEVPP